MKVLFLGSKRLGLNVLKNMLVIAPNSVTGAITIDDRSDDRSVYKDFFTVAKNNNLQLEIAKNRKHAEQIICEFKPDLCFVVCWYWLISAKTLQRIPKGFIGIHNSLLPKYRGSSPLIWTMINGEPEAGFSIFSFTEGMDDGKIWASDKVKIKKDDYISDILDKLEVKTLKIMQFLYPKILDGTTVTIEQNHNNATYCSPRFEFDGVIDWHKSAKEIHNFIRAQSTPYPGAFTYFNDSKLTIWKARLNELTYYGTPGQVARVDETGVYIVCGDAKSIVLETVELNGVEARAEQVIKSVKIRFPRVPEYKKV